MTKNYRVEYSDKIVAENKLEAQAVFEKGIKEVMASGRFSHHCDIMVYNKKDEDKIKISGDAQDD